jgi:hypothetical protein
MCLHTGAESHCPPVNNNVIIVVVMINSHAAVFLITIVLMPSNRPHQTHPASHGNALY